MIKTTEIIKIVDRELGVSASEITSSSIRQTGIVRARHIAMFVAMSLTDQSTETIARYFKCDRSTVVYAIEGIERRIKRDAGLNHDVSRILEICRGGVAVTAAPADECPHCHRVIVTKEIVESLKRNVSTLSAQIELLGGAA